jgi:hypothetical protein
MCLSLSSYRRSQHCSAFPPSIRMVIVSFLYLLMCVSVFLQPVGSGNAILDQGAQGLQPQALEDSGGVGLIGAFFF